MNMSFVDRARCRLAVRLLVGVPLLVVVACASRKEDGLFDSTPGEPTGSPSGGRAPVAVATSGGSPAVIVSTGGMPAISPPETGGTTGSGGVAPSGGAGGVAGEPGEPSPEPAAGGPAASGGTQAGGGGGSAAVGESGGSDATGSSGMASSTGGDDSATGSGGTPSCQSRVELCDGMDNDCDGDADEGDTCPENCLGFGGLDSAYMFCTQLSTGAVALSACNDAGMRLAWVETADENQLLLAQVAKLMGVEPGDTGDGEDQAQVRIGGTDREEEGTWHWFAADAGPVFWQQASNAEDPWQGEAVSGMFANWSEDRPNQGGNSGENCLVMELEDGDDGDAGQWNDVGCATEHPFVCEMP